MKDFTKEQGTAKRESIDNVKSTASARLKYPRAELTGTEVVITWIVMAFMLCMVSLWVYAQILKEQQTPRVKKTGETITLEATIRSLQYSPGHDTRSMNVGFSTAGNVVLMPTGSKANDQYIVIAEHDEGTAILPVPKTVWQQFKEGDSVLLTLDEYAQVNKRSGERVGTQYEFVGVDKSGRM